MHASIFCPLFSQKQSANQPKKNRGKCFTTKFKSTCKNSGTFEGKKILPEKVTYDRLAPSHSITLTTWTFSTKRGKILVTSHVKMFLMVSTRMHGMWMDDKQIDKPFKMYSVKGWTASEKLWTHERLKENFEWMRLKKIFERQKPKGFGKFQLNG